MKKSFIASGRGPSGPLVIDTCIYGAWFELPHALNYTKSHCTWVQRVRENFPCMTCHRSYPGVDRQTRGTCSLYLFDFLGKKVSRETNATELNTLHRSTKFAYFVY